MQNIKWMGGKGATTGGGEEEVLTPNFASEPPTFETVFFFGGPFWGVRYSWTCDNMSVSNVRIIMLNLLSSVIIVADFHRGVHSMLSMITMRRSVSLKRKGGAKSLHTFLKSEGKLFTCKMFVSETV